MLIFSSKDNLIVTLRYFLTFIFIFSAFLKILDFENTIILFMDTFKISYFVIKSFLVILILVELLIAFILFKEFYTEPSLYYAILIILLSFIGINVIFLFKNVDNCGCFGTVVQSRPWSSLIKSVTMIIMFQTLVNHRRKNYV